jgi:hypothetical protein
MLAKKGLAVSSACNVYDWLEKTAATDRKPVAIEVEHAGRTCTCMWSWSVERLTGIVKCNRSTKIVIYHHVSDSLSGAERFTKISTIVWQKVDNADLTRSRTH